MKNPTITSGAAVNPPPRSLKDVSIDELKAAVAKMSEELGISGSGADYSLYQAIFREKKKVSPDDPASKLID